MSSQGSSGEDFDKFDLDNLDEADKENLCNDFKKKIKDANLTKEKARSILLGQQWFAGRTGVSATVNNPANGPSDKYYAEFFAFETAQQYEKSGD